LGNIIYEKKRGRNNNGAGGSDCEKFSYIQHIDLGWGNGSVLQMVFDDIYNILLLMKKVCLHACNPLLCEVRSLAIAISTRLPLTTTTGLVFPTVLFFIISTCITLCLPITTTLHPQQSTANDRNLHKDAFNSKFQNYFAKKRNNKKHLTKSQYDHIIDVCAKRDELDKSSFLEYVNPFLAKSLIFFPISHKKTTQPIGLPTT